VEQTKIILASKSPRRMELMTRAGYEFEIITSNIEEKITQSKPSLVVEELSYQKAKNVYDMIMSNSTVNLFDDDVSLLIIGADTVVALDDKIMGKPLDKEDAFKMLKELQNNTHQVYTGVTLIKYNFGTKTTTSKSFHECTNVTLYPMSNMEIYDYIATNDHMDKAGSYGIQGPFAIHVQKIDGDYNNVVGLPIARLYQELKNN